MAHSNKTKKSLAKRVKITGRNKVLKRPPGQNHFNAKSNGNATRNKKGLIATPHQLIKDVKALIAQ